MQLRRIQDPTIPEKKPEPEKPIPVATSFFENPEGEDPKESTVAPRSLPNVDSISVFIRPLGMVLLGALLLAFGIWNAGGFYETGSRLSGSLATFFYTWQIANILEFVGFTLLYVNVSELIDVWKTSRKN